VGGVRVVDVCSSRLCYEVGAESWWVYPALVCGSGRMRLSLYVHWGCVARAGASTGITLLAVGGGFGVWVCVCCGWCRGFVLVEFGGCVVFCWFRFGGASGVGGSFWEFELASLLVSWGWDTTGRWVVHCAGCPVCC